jgi:putative copper export protein
MDPNFWVNVLMRWLHVGAAVVGVGGTVMMRLVLLPILDRLPNGAEVLAAVRPPFKRLIHSAIGLLFLTGIYNYALVAIPKVREFKGAEPNPLAPYHGVMGLKILLSLVLFGIAFALLKPVPALHENRKTWLSVNVVLGLLILLLAAYLRRLWPVATP